MRLAVLVVLVAVGCHRRSEPIVDAAPVPDTSPATVASASATTSAADAAVTLEAAVDATATLEASAPAVSATAPTPVVMTLTRDELTKRTAPFASGGGGKRYLVAIAASERGGAYGFHHWGGFWTTAALDDAVITRPDPPLLLVLNHPHDRESKDQNATEEIVRWRDDGSFVATGARYSKWDLGQSTDDFAKTAARLLVGTKR